MHRLSPGVHQQEASGAIGILGLSWVEAGLSNQRRLLISENSGDWDIPQRRPLRVAVDLTARADTGQHRVRNTKRVEEILVPRQGLEIHQLSPAGIGDVGDVNATLGATGKMPNQERIEIAKQNIPAFRQSTNPRYVFE